jgi:SH3 domain-containing YSC84-like protein 1
VQKISRRRAILLAAAAAVAAGWEPRAALAQVVSEQQRLIDRARIVVEEFQADPNFTHVPIYVQNAYAVLIVPDMRQGGLILGVEQGAGVLLARDPISGAWGDPAFYEIWGGSLGLQIGGRSSDVILTLMNPDAVDKLLTTSFKLGADASIAVGRIGAGVGAGTTMRFGEDMYFFARTRGLFGGLALDGSVVNERTAWNEAFYGEGVSARQILLGELAPRPGAAALREALARF